MKFRSITLVLLVLLVILGTSSCVKKYTCQCKIYYSGAPGLPDTTINEYDITDKKSGAKSTCEGESYEHEENGIKVTETCKLY